MTVGADFIVVHYAGFRVAGMYWRRCGNEDSSACEGHSDARSEHKTETITYSWLMVTPALQYHHNILEICV